MVHHTPDGIADTPPQIHNQQPTTRDIQGGRAGTRETPLQRARPSWPQCPMWTSLPSSWRHLGSMSSSPSTCRDGRRPVEGAVVAQPLPPLRILPRYASSVSPRSAPSFAWMARRALPSFQPDSLVRLTFTSSSIAGSLQPFVSTCETIIHQLEAWKKPSGDVAAACRLRGEGKREKTNVPTFYSGIQDSHGLFEG